MVMPWHPAAIVGIAGLTLVATTPSVGSDPMWRLRIAGVGLAAATSYVLDDRAAATVGSSPLTLVERRALRLGVVVPMIATWWMVAVGLLSVRLVAPLPPTSHLVLELATYTAVGTAASVWLQRRSDDGEGGIAGAVVVATLFSSSILPLPAWWPLGSSGTDAVLSLRLAFVAAVIALVAGSLDLGWRPARRRARRAHVGLRAPKAGCTRSP
jgi:hypothetical protein